MEGPWRAVDALVDVAQPGETTPLSDGRLKFQVVEVMPPKQIRCRVVVGGILSSGKGVNLPDTGLKISPVTEKDRSDVEWIAEHDFDLVAVSFVRSVFRAKCDGHCCVAGPLAAPRHRSSDHTIIAQVEKPIAIEQIDAIIRETDAIMVARGDLGVEMDFPSVRIVQEKTAHRCQVAGKPCIIATEMPESVVHTTRPARAEVSDVANAVFGNADAVMLSAESAVSEYPVAAVEAMSRTLASAEELIINNQRATNFPVGGGHAPTTALASALTRVMQMLDVALIATFTGQGTSVRLMSKNQPPLPILSRSCDFKATRRTCLLYGVVPHFVIEFAGVEHFLEQVNDFAVDLPLARPGEDVVVLTGNLVGTEGDKRGLVVEHVVNSEPET